MSTELREQVRQRYAEAAKAGSGCCNESCCSEDFGESLYTAEQRKELPDAAALVSLGCGNPTAVAELREGETVLDLGSGGGIDVILSAKRVGATGVAYGLDMTDEMLALARANAEEAGVTNAHFLKGEIEQVPLPDASVDVVISNCVINLSTDKPAVLAEAARVLRPGGRFGVSDVVAEDHLTPAGASRARQLRRLHRGRALALGVRRRTRGCRFRGRLGRVHARGRGRNARRDRAGSQGLARSPPRSGDPPGPRTPSVRPGCSRARRGGWL